MPALLAIVSFDFYHENDDMRHYAKSLFIFRRDLRLIDNVGLNAALAQSQQVVLAFILDPRQIEMHPYRSTPGPPVYAASVAGLATAGQ